VKGNLFTVPESKTLILDVSQIDAVVGIGYDYSASSKISYGEVSINVLGTVKYTFSVSGDTITIVPIPTTDAVKCAGFANMPNLLFCLIMLVMFNCRGKINMLMLLLCVLVMFGSVSSDLPTQVSVLLLPGSEEFLTSLTINAKTVPIVTTDLRASNIIQCQQNGAAVNCGSQMCNYEDTNCIQSSFNYVGVLLDLTGNSSTNGPAMQQAINYFLSQDGFYTPSVQFIVADTQSTSTGAVTAATNLFTNYGVQVFVGPVASSEVLAIFQSQIGSDVIIISPGASATSLTEMPDANLISLSMSNDFYIDALLMLINNDFSNLLQNLIVIYRNDTYGQDLAYWFEENRNSNITDTINITYFPYDYNSDTSISSAVQSAASSIRNFTAIVAIAYSEITQILQTAQTLPQFNNVPWYGIGLAFNPGFNQTTNLGFAQNVQFKTVEYRGANIQDQTFERTQFYENMTGYAQRPLSSSVALAYDAALLALSLTEVFENEVEESYALLVEEAAYTFGVSGWLTQDQYGFRLTGDFLINQVIGPNPFAASWTELGYVEIQVHEGNFQGEVFSYYDITHRFLGNYVLTTEWTTNCTKASVDIYTRDISRQSQHYHFGVDNTTSVSVPLYDSLILNYNCNDSYLSIYCPSTLYGSDTQCYLTNILPSQGQKRGAPLPKPKSPETCSHSASPDGCVSLTNGQPVKCPSSSNGQCSSALLNSCCSSNKDSFCCTSSSSTPPKCTQ
jgi:ABC-type branched-subunit amino acid transport system substrate-binding protein